MRISYQVKRRKEGNERVLFLWGRKATGNSGFAPIGLCGGVPHGLLNRADTARQGIRANSLGCVSHFVYQADACTTVQKDSWSGVSLYQLHDKWIAKVFYSHQAFEIFLGGILAQPSVPVVLNAKQIWQYSCVRSMTFCGRLVACTILRTFNAPSSSINFRTEYSRSGENWLKSAN